MISLFQKETVYFDLFEQLSAHVVSCAERLRTLAGNFPSAAAEIDRIHFEEHEADDVTHRALTQLGHVFLPPIDREDVHAAAGGDE